MTIVRYRTALLALSFVGVTLLTQLGAMAMVDQQGAAIANRIACYPLDVIASLLTLLGNIEITGLIALTVSVKGWRREGLPGLTPLLLFAGVAIEITLKYCLSHPGESHSRQLWHLTVVHPSFISMLHYSFPSGHVFRTTFLAELLSRRANRYHNGACLLIIAMALTRVYLHEHWVSDVVGGWLLGLTLASVASSAGSPQN
jgi:membrane-associated phospholipid phosphatase